MTRLDAAVAELVAALREEVRTQASGPGPDRLLSIDVAAEQLGVGRTLLYRELNAGRLRSVRAGRRRLIPSSALAGYVAEKEGAARQGGPLQEASGAQITRSPIAPS